MAKTEDVRLELPVLTDTEHGEIVRGRLADHRVDGRCRFHETDRGRRVTVDLGSGRAGTHDREHREGRAVTVGESRRKPQR